MKINIAAVGVLKKGPEATLVEEYCRRFAGIGQQHGLKDLRIIEIDSAKSLPREQRRAREAEQLISQTPVGSCIIVLDEHGKTTTSTGLASMIADIRDDGIGDISFLIGGADGHGQAVRDLIACGKARTLSFGTTTWPHMLVRVMLCEQLYRAATILDNHPYHRE